MKFKNPPITWDSIEDNAFYKARYGVCPPDIQSLFDSDHITTLSKLELFLKCEAVPEKTKLLLAVRSLKELSLGDGRKMSLFIQDERSIRAIETAQEYALGNATEKEREETIRPSWKAASAWFSLARVTPAAYLADAAWAISRKDFWSALSRLDTAFNMLSRRNAAPEILEIAKSMIEP